MPDHRVAGIESAVSVRGVSKLTSGKFALLVGSGSAGGTRDGKNLARVQFPNLHRDIMPVLRNPKLSNIAHFCCFFYYQGGRGQRAAQLRRDFLVRDCQDEQMNCDLMSEG
jgi:hypothetical protein